MTCSLGYLGFREGGTAQGRGSGHFQEEGNDAKVVAASEGHTGSEGARVAECLAPTGQTWEKSGCFLNHIVRLDSIRKEGAKFINPRKTT